MTQMLSKVNSLYSENVRTMGASPRSVGWRDVDSQKLRFEKLTQVITGRGLDKPVTINDLGCGYGALFSYLVADRKLEVGKYTGYDISAEMLETAAGLTDPARCEFRCGPRITDPADYSFVSGTFNVKFEVNDDKWRGYVIDCLHNLDRHSVRGFAFNLLTTYVDYMESHLYYGDPLFYFDLCKRIFSKKITLIHDYNLFEWTILVHKD